MITDGHTTRFNINVWESKMVKKLNANADHYPPEALRMAYVDSHVNREAYKYLAMRSKIGAQKPFATAKEIFEILQKTYDNVNWAHTAINKFWDLKITKNFNSFWTEFQVLVSELDHNESTFICELKLKLIPSLSQAMAGGVSRPKNIHKYVKQCQETYQDLKDIEIWTPVTNFAGNQYNWGETNTNMNMGTSTGMNANAKTANCSKRFANFFYSRSSSVASNSAVAMRPARSDATRFTREKIAKLQREDQCFHCKEVKDHRLQCSKE